MPPAATPSTRVWRLKKGEALRSRGRQALQAAAMSEEAERLSRKAEDLRGEALHLRGPNGE